MQHQKQDLPNSLPLTECKRVADSGALPLSIPVPQQPLSIPVPQTSPQPSKFSVELPLGQSVRKYQWELAKLGLQGSNYIFVAPTGSGKTLVAALVIADHLQKRTLDKNCHVVFIVDTKPLADQQKKNLKKFIPQAKVEAYTGDNTNTVADSIKENNISVCTAGKLLDEIRQDRVKFSQLSLMIFDECHHTRKSHPYAQLMKRYLEERQQLQEDTSPDQLCLQIIGMTASPGAGENPNLEEMKTIDHLLMLTALLDATSGIKRVEKYTAELEKCTKTSSFTRKIMRSRDHTSDPFITEVTAVMKHIEMKIEDMKSCKFDRWSQEYETKVQQIILPLQTSTDEGFRDFISALKQLRGYCTALSVYMDLRDTDAIKAIEEFSDIPEDNAKATDAEIDLKKIKADLLSQLKVLHPKQNPMLRGLETILIEKFTDKQESRAILFVRTKKHTVAMKDWISNNPKLKVLDINPDIITGHSSERGDGMTQVKQEEVMEKFHEGKTNLLIATSVAEEGLDVPACNLVIRYQHVSNEIAKVQTEGRARADDSDGYTILSSSSNKKYQEMKNDELVLLVNNIFENSYFPTGDDLREHITQLQGVIIQERKMKALYRTPRQTHEASKVRLLCNKCKVFACFGSDVCTIGKDNSYHYVVHRLEFRQKFFTKIHSRPCLLTSTVLKIHKIYCLKCGNDWGIECIWPRGHTHPVLKCKSFIFEINGYPFPTKKWSEVPFQIEPLSSKIELESDSESDTESS